MNADILRIADSVIIDESISEYEHLEYNPIAGTNLNDGGDITITIELQDIFTHPSESFLLIEGELLKNDGTRYANADNITLTNNGIMYLFKRIRYDLAEKEIESVQNTRQATTMLGLLKYPDDFSKSLGLNQLWFKDTNPDASRVNNLGFNLRQDYIIQRPDPKGAFSFRIPLKHIYSVFAKTIIKLCTGLNKPLL